MLKFLTIVNNSHVHTLWKYGTTSQKLKRVVRLESVYVYSVAMHNFSCELIHVSIFFFVQKHSCKTVTCTSDNLNTASNSIFNVYLSNLMESETDG